MRIALDKRVTILSCVYRGGIVLLVSLVIVLIAGTIYGVFFFDAPHTQTAADNSQKSGEGQTFTGIGRIRVPTRDPQPGMVIIFASFIYHPDDKTFSEELVLRIEDFRNSIKEYVGSFSVSELHALSEETMKSELLRRFNAVLRLGQIEDLFFSDYMIVE